MERLTQGMIATLAGLGALALLATPGAAHGPNQGGPGIGMMGPGIFMGQNQGTADDAPRRPWPGYYGMGPGMMGPMGYGMTPGMMMGPGYGYGPGMMGPGMGYMMGPRMGYGMGAGAMHNMMHGGGAGYGPGMGYGAPCWQQDAAADEDLGPDDVKARMERWLVIQGNDRLKLGKVEIVDDDTIIVEIVTVDDSLVRKLAVNRHNGWTRPAQ